MKPNTALTGSQQACRIHPHHAPLAVLSLLMMLQVSPFFLTVSKQDCSLLQRVSGSDSLLCLEAITPCSCHPGSPQNRRASKTGQRSRNWWNPSREDQTSPWAPCPWCQEQSEVTRTSLARGRGEAERAGLWGARIPRRASKSIDPVFKNTSSEALLGQCWTFMVCKGRNGVLGSLLRPVPHPAIEPFIQRNAILL